MTEDLKFREELKQYLLGQIADEAWLDRIEEQLFSDAAFLEELQISENELIDAYLFGELNKKELESFKRLFLADPERREKVLFAGTFKNYTGEQETTKTVETSEKTAFGLFGYRFSTPQFASALAVLMLVVACVAGLLVFTDKQDSSVLAELNTIYSKERPVESRISGIEHAPYIALRGNAKTDDNQLKREKIGKDIEDAVKQKPDADSYNLCGIQFLLEKQFDNAVAQFENALKLSPDNAEIRANLGAAYLEKAKKQSGEERTQTLQKSLDELNKAIEIDKNRLEPLFNKALALQEMNRTDEAVQAWQQYLERDKDSKWAIEARSNLEKLN